jgi:hypothetical protein
MSRRVCPLCGRRWPSELDLLGHVTGEHRGHLLALLDRDERLTGAIKRVDLLAASAHQIAPSSPVTPAEMALATVLGKIKEAVNGSTDPGPAAADLREPH